MKPETVSEDVEREATDSNWEAAYKKWAQKLGREWVSLVKPPHAFEAGFNACATQPKAGDVDRTAILLSATSDEIYALSWQPDGVANKPAILQMRDNLNAWADKARDLMEGK